MPDSVPAKDWARVASASAIADESAVAVAAEGRPVRLTLTLTPPATQSILTFLVSVIDDDSYVSLSAPGNLAR